MTEQELKKKGYVRMWDIPKNTTINELEGALIYGDSNNRILNGIIHINPAKYMYALHTNGQMRGDIPYPEGTRNSRFSYSWGLGVKMSGHLNIPTKFDDSPYPQMWVRVKDRELYIPKSLIIKLFK